MYDLNEYYEQQLILESSETYDQEELYEHEFMRRNLDRYKSSGSAQEIFNFVAFLCWYLFLLICCIIPTICAYRRRSCIRRSRDESPNNPNTNEIIIEENDVEERTQRQTTRIGSRDIRNFRLDTEGILVLDGTSWNNGPMISYVGRGSAMDPNLVKRIKRERIILLSYNTKMVCIVIIIFCYLYFCGCVYTDRSVL